MSWLSRGIKKARKALHLPAITLGNVAKVGGALATGGVGALGAAAIASKLRNAAVGGIKQVVRSKAEKALHDRLATLLPSHPGTATPAAQTMPGGAPLRALGAKVVRAAHSRRARRAASSPRKARSAPKGGLDLRALSASWKAAGKPGRWIDWVKAHR